MSDNHMNCHLWCRACILPLVCKSFREACEPQAVGNLWSHLALSARTLRTDAEQPYEERLSWVSSRMKQVNGLRHQTWQIRMLNSLINSNPLAAIHSTLDISSIDDCH